MAARPEVAPGSSGRAEEGIGIARQTRPARPARARPVRRARVYASGLGYTGLRLNGRMVGGERERDPGYTSFDRRVLYVTHDVTSLLRQGEERRGPACQAFGSWEIGARRHGVVAGEFDEPPPQ